MPAMWNEAERVRVEEAWPDYSEREDLLLLPSFFGDSVDEWGLTERCKWEEVLAGRLEHDMARGCLSKEIRQIMQNFMLTFMVRYPAATGEDDSDEGEEDVELQPLGP